MAKKMTKKQRDWKKENSLLRYVHQSRSICEDHNGLAYCKNCQIDFDELEKRIEKQIEIERLEGTIEWVDNLPDLVIDKLDPINTEIGRIQQTEFERGVSHIYYQYDKWFLEIERRLLLLKKQLSKLQDK